MGKLVVIEGLDGSGKTTQTARLAETLAARGENFRMVNFPNYQSPSSALVRMYLNGDFGQDPMQVNAYAASAFYAVDRYAGWKTDWGGFYESGGLVLADRYTTSNAIHQCSKLPKAQWEDYIAWLTAFEYEKLGIPKPDLVIFLDADPAHSQKLLSGRYGGDAKKDIHERNLAYLRRSREAAHWCAGRLGWKMLLCSGANGIRPFDDISADIDRTMQEALNMKGTV